MSLSLYIYISFVRRTMKQELWNSKQELGRVQKVCARMCQELFIDISSACESYVKRMWDIWTHVRWWSCTHLNQVRTAIKTNVSETSSIVPHGCSCMKISLGDDSIFQWDELYDAIWPEIVKNVCKPVEKIKVQFKQLCKVHYAQCSSHHKLHYLLRTLH